MTTKSPRGEPNDARERVYDAILVHCQAHGGQAPTLQDLCVLTGLRSVSTIAYHIEGLARDQRIELVRVPGSRRTSRQARISGAMWLPPADVARVARLIRATAAARTALLDHGASVVDDVARQLARALGDEPAEASVPPPARLPAPRLTLAGREGWAA